MRTEIEWTDDAWEHYQACTRRTFELGSHYGGPVGYEYAANFHSMFQSVTFAAGPVRVAKDGDGFYISAPHIVIGLVWTPDTVEQMERRLRAAGCPLDGPINPTWPRTGAWSAHS